MTTMTDALKRAIRDCGLPMLTLEQRTGVKRQSVMRFMANRQSLRLDMADRLAAHLGLELRPAKGRRKAKG
jgi:plasmid maintenance system antidote protein VapI